jgi:CxxC motif-containing protein (DUF1111 family)
MRTIHIIASRSRLLTPVLVFFGIIALTAVGASSAANFGDPLEGLTPEQQALFEAGKEEFEAEETVEEGLGPVFNDKGCANCHNNTAIGGGSTITETRFGTITARNFEPLRFDPLAEHGGSLIQSQGIGRVPSCQEVYTGEVVPKEATVTAQRRTTPLFGLGLVDAVPDATFHAMAADSEDDVRGLVNIVTNLTGGSTVGKFGWKAQVPTLFQFAGDAYLNEMGITNPQFPNENCPQGDCDALACNPVPQLNDDGEGVDLFTDFMTFLAPPPRGQITQDVKDGERLFQDIGCASCHRPTLQTGAHPVAALNHQTFHPYSDFLLHNMGSLGDGITQDRATGQLMRTAPLWGIRVIERFLHDGRAATLEAAILAHDGQAKRARDHFTDLSQRDKQRLLAFLNSL